MSVIVKSGTLAGEYNDLTSYLYAEHLLQHNCEHQHVEQKHRFGGNRHGNIWRHYHTVCTDCRKVLDSSRVWLSPVQFER